MIVLRWKAANLLNKMTFINKYFMGNSYPSSTQESNDAYKFNRVSDIPQGKSPPSLNEVQEKVIAMSCLFSQKFDPLELQKCRECLTSNYFSRKHEQIEEVEKICTDLSMFQTEDPAFTEKTYQFKKVSAPEIWISSTKNSDQTISYWFQYPILPFHIQAAMLTCLQLPVTQENMSDICDRYEPLYKQLLKLNQHEVCKCEQVEPLYVDIAIRSLIVRGYKAHRKYFSIE